MIVRAFFVAMLLSTTTCGSLSSADEPFDPDTDKDCKNVRKWSSKNPNHCQPPRQPTSTVLNEDDPDYPPSEDLTLTECGLPPDKKGYQIIRSIEPGKIKGVSKCLAEIAISSFSNENRVFTKFNTNHMRISGAFFETSDRKDIFFYANSLYLYVNFSRYCAAEALNEKNIRIRPSFTNEEWLRLEASSIRFKTNLLSEDFEEYNYSPTKFQSSLINHAKALDCDLSQLREQFDDEQ